MEKMADCTISTITDSQKLRDMAMRIVGRRKKNEGKGRGEYLENQNREEKEENERGVQFH